MTNENLVKFLRLNAHLGASVLQQVLFQHGHVVPFDKIQGVLYSLDTANEVNQITTAKGHVIDIHDLDTIIQYALAAGMPRTYLRNKE